ncbi:uncharacterized protein H6S33_004148 [Morchella sextelata]|uniref:uncharacterized protein n=4 Tax=Morchella sextelata TaxID=1174677 RepID=UPI001D05318A|nr:uncharacterized protein H6S33_007590 [Morchella sextelata]XP_044691682.1 uncharacterized protein H6S33_004148 [Morchella sextelata]KAH0603268.1 hypothetical protein H6S33_007590 [Morchella sextelata]KAH0606487.1 hypothetical protein H6S33_004148 [Morchella sextelata]
MDNDMGEYVWSCDTGQSNKSSSHEKYRMLPYSEVLNTPCSSISMDFFVSLPESEAYTRIGVIVERFTKITYFIPLKTEATIKELSQIFLQEICRLHGLSELFISDRDFRFESKFWHSLIKLLGVNLCLSTAYRPQADRRKLDNANVSSPVPKFKWKALWKTMRTDIFKAQARQKKWYDQKHMKPPQPEDGDKVMMDRRNMVANRPSSKLDYKKLCLFEVDEKLVVAFYTLKLPS